MADLLPSDPDDSDYQPPPARMSGVGTSAAPKANESDTDSEAADAFYLQDAVPEYADSDLERPPPRYIGSAGAGSSSRPGGALGAGGSSGAGGSLGAGGSSGAGGSARAGSSSGVSGLSSAAPPPRGSGASVANGASSGAKDDGCDEITPVLPAKEKEPAVDVKQAENDKAAKNTESAKEASASKAVDDLWREMNKPIAKATNLAKPSKQVDSGLGDWLKQPAIAKTTITKVPRLEEIESKRAAEESDEIQPVKKQKLGTGLEDILNAVKSEQKSNTLEKTKESWKEFKEDDKAVEEELEAYKKDKDRYTDKVAFLERTDRREWEVEQAGRKKR